MILVSSYNVFSQALYAAFGDPVNEIYLFLDLFIELLFSLDFAFCFCQEYNDEETYCLISDVKKIAIHYLKGSCFFDLLAIIPFSTFFVDKNSIKGDPKNNKARLFRLIKLLRVPRLFELLNVDRFKKYIKDYYNNKLLESVSNDKETENYPILRAIMYV